MGEGFLCFGKRLSRLAQLFGLLFDNIFRREFGRNLAKLDQPVLVLRGHFKNAFVLRLKFVVGLICHAYLLCALGVPGEDFPVLNKAGQIF